MPRTIIIRLPVADLKASMAFYTALGFVNNPQFTDDSVEPPEQPVGAFAADGQCTLQPSRSGRSLRRMCGIAPSACAAP